MRTITGTIRACARRLPGRRDESARGATALEAVLLLPALFFMLLGIIESGNMLENWLRLHKAAQAGARVAVTGQGAEEGDRLNLIVSKVGELLMDMPAENLAVTVSSYPGHDLEAVPLAGIPGDPCDTVEVKVLYQYQPVTPFMDNVFTGPITLSARDRKVNEPWGPCQ